MAGGGGEAGFHAVQHEHASKVNYDGGREGACAGLAAFLLSGGFFAASEIPRLPVWVKVILIVVFAIVVGILVSRVFNGMRARRAAQDDAEFRANQDAERTRQLDEMRAKKPRVPKVER